ncbi:hypothetical protein PHLGIDRAFT_253634 [Phlebiopsis gigantea 11061_1 CR5-6]|uniref:GED domain-containing protein n=1 Tax=Phlebiopsis gigantea (strain 11061_1 CR5-6) TaxID=745531 RepID=A0A0C3RS80_PHLG1|nr:hypothetical protein PHLGIDRAFT_253634 [Phlebiopsis gigantea 11061_1 CR5-6]
MNVPHSPTKRTEPASSQPAPHARELIKLIVGLRALGAEADLDLPRIAVIGDQSAGKGALVEAISGLTVPRIRCPMECRLASSTTPWRAQVLLRRRGAARETTFGAPQHSPAALEAALRRAQLAVLHPTVPLAVFEALDDAAAYAPPPGAQGPLACSHDVVCVDVEGPGLPDLAFIDLPGIASTVAKGEAQSDIDAVTQMVRDHIKGNTLIVMTINMRDDMNNQGAARLARLEDPIGCRTIGVLTNPVLMQAGEEHSWLRILQGFAHRVAHGYFITKHPSPKGLEERISHAEVREREAAFFDTMPPWSLQTELRPRMGTPSLTSQLSNLLGALIRRSIPGLRVQAEESLEAVKRSLDRLPPPPSDNPMAKLLDILADLHASVQALVAGSEGSGQLLQQCRRAHRQLKSDILGTAPRFRPFKSKDAPDAVSAARSEPQDDLSAPPPWYLDDVRAHIRCSMTRQLALNTPFAAKVDLMCVRRSVAAWAAHGAACLAAVHAATRAELRALAQARLGACTGSPLLADVLALLDDVLECHRARTAELIRFQLELQEKPSTLNDGDFAAGREEYLARYRAVRKCPLGGRHDAAVGDILERLAKIGLHATPADLAKLLPHDAYEEELTLMAETSAYFCVASTRVVDDIPCVIDHGLLDALARDMHGALVAGLALAGPGADARAARYLTEHPQVVAERTRLTQKRARLEAALQALRAFQTAAGPAHDAAPLPTADCPAAPPCVLRGWGRWKVSDAA